VRSMRAVKGVRGGGVATARRPLCPRPALAPDCREHVRATNYDEAPRVSAAPAGAAAPTGVAALAGAGPAPVDVQAAPAVDSRKARLEW
jgi:hypothetical protein